MAFRFWRRIKFAPGLTLNLSKRGMSVSAGRRGAKLTTGTSGERATFGITGTGLFYTKKLSPKPSRADRVRPQRGQPLSPPPPRPEDRLDLGFFKRLVTPPEEQAFIDGLREIVRGNHDLARSRLQTVAHLPDAAVTLGLLCIMNEKTFEEAAEHLTYAVQHEEQLGRYYAKYGIAIMFQLEVTEHVLAQIGPNLRGALLGLAEVYQRREQWQEAIACLKQLREVEPNDPVLALSFVELVDNTLSEDRGMSEEIICICKDIRNESDVHAALLMYKGKALRRLGLLDAARKTLNLALRRKKGRSEDLIRALKYERACLYEELGRSKQARAEFEKIYAEAPDYEDVAKRLGL